MSAAVIDISEYQDDDIISTARESMGIGGVIIRLGLTYHGEPTMDDKFITFVNKAVELGLPYGIYYYSKMTDSDWGLKEAQFINDKVYELLNGQEPGMGVFWDMEDSLVQYDGVYSNLMNAIDTMSNWGFKKTGIYANKSYFETYMDLDDLANRGTRLWLAQYNDEPELINERPSNNWVCWQYTDKANGMSLDGDIWYE